MFASARTARETVDLFLHTAVQGSRDELAELYAPDAVIEIPFAPGGVPGVTRGRETLRERMNAAAGRWDFTSVENVTVHETTDPAVLIVEYRINGQVTATGNPFALNYIAVMRVENGLIASARDYGNPEEVSALMSA
ncbi:MAG TPA: nuclear transport factor 2 family protein [Actinocrinis sp.]|nr:nuclear transport factor 2 family protein [Actinocrinis sp.]